MANNGGVAFLVFYVDLLLSKVSVAKTEIMSSIVHAYGLQGICTEATQRCKGGEGGSAYSVCLWWWDTCS